MSATRGAAGGSTGSPRANRAQESVARRRLREPAVPPRVLVALAAIAALLGAALPAGRSADGIVGWWSGEPSSVLGGVMVMLAAPLLAAASFAPSMRALGLLGAALSLAGAALWALGAAPDSAAPLIVVASLAVAPCAMVLAAPRPDAPTALSTLPWWMIGGGLALLLAAALAMRGPGAAAVIAPSPPALVMAPALLAAVATITAGVLTRRAIALHDSRRTHRARAAIVIALVIAIVFVGATIVAPIMRGDRSTGVLAARLAMLAVTAIVALVSQLPATTRGTNTPRADPFHPTEPTHGFR